MHNPVSLPKQARHCPSLPESVIIVARSHPHCPWSKFTARTSPSWPRGRRSCWVTTVVSSPDNYRLTAATGCWLFLCRSCWTLPEQRSLDKGLPLFWEIFDKKRKTNTGTR
ncbi:unnamed protein product [Cuscuta campestris]|uniref:Uncharacterized protein n=1 Tax=Cuscuta campestris TaxID=132261 RepID=A0A484NG02_9ASTE|nr:unnamed protein product [Cuscuta campestris]VFR03024.1 unnamed protein product [Cuscuta campestris]